MRELEAPLQKHFSQVTQAQLIAKPPQHDEEDEIGRIFQGVEGGSGALVEGALARSRSGTSDSKAWCSWSVPWVSLTHSGGSSWFTPSEDGLNDRQSTTKGSSLWILFSVLTLP
jgi:hypothetical protein